MCNHGRPSLTPHFSEVFERRGSDSSPGAHGIHDTQLKLGVKEKVIRVTNLCNR